MMAAGRLALIGLPYVYGERGVGMGRAPLLLLADARVPARLRAGGADVAVRWVDCDEPAPDEGLAPGDAMSRQLAQARALARLVGEARAEGRAPIVFAGSCSAAIGVTSGLDDDGIGIVWLDAHPDSETPETSLTGLFDGMPVATIAGRCWKAWREQVPGFHVVPDRRIVMVGLHEPFAPPAQRPWQHQGTAIGRAVDPPAVAEHGFAAALAAALDALAAETDRVYLHIDTDVLDPAEARASAYTADGGLPVARVLETIAAVGERFDVLATTFSAYDPAVDPRMPEVVERLAAAVAGTAAEVAA